MAMVARDPERRRQEVQWGPRTGLDVPDYDRLLKIELCHLGLDDAQLGVLADALPPCSQVCVLNLTGNRIGCAGVVRLAAALPAVKATLRSVFLMENRVGDAGALALAHTFPQLPRLRRLGVSGNAMGREGALALARCLPQIPQLDCLYADHLGKYAGGSRLQKPKLHNTAEVHAAFAAAIGSCRRLNLSTLSGVRLADHEAVFQFRGAAGAPGRDAYNSQALRFLRQRQQSRMALLPLLIGVSGHSMTLRGVDIEVCEATLDMPDADTRRLRFLRRVMQQPPEIWTRVLEALYGGRIGLKLGHSA